MTNAPRALWAGAAGILLVCGCDSRGGMVLPRYETRILMRHGGGTPPPAPAPVGTGWAEVVTAEPVPDGAAYPRPVLAGVRPARPAWGAAQPVRENPWAVQTPRAWKYIVIHHSATDGGNAELFDRSHRARGFDELGYHFVITNGNGATDGLIEVGSRWWKQKWGAHTGGTPDNEYNDFGIGVGVVGDFTDKLPSSAQLASLRRLVGCLVAAHDIPVRNVIGHRDAPNTATACPGEKLHAWIWGPLHQELTKRLAAR